MHMHEHDMGAEIQQMRNELTAVGAVELRSPQDVDRELGEKKGTVMVIVNSVCGCAAGKARPGVALAMEHAKLPKKIFTVFAGQDKEATARAREYFEGMPPSSPSMVLLRDGKVAFALHRADIEDREAQDIAKRLTAAFDQLC